MKVWLSKMAIFAYFTRYIFRTFTSKATQGCSGAGTQRNAVPANSFEPERRSGKYCWTQAER